MTIFNEYNENQDAEAYDMTRVSIGLDIIKKYLKPNTTILDIGCGTGNHLSEIDKLVTNCQLVGTDMSCPMLLRCNQKFNPTYQGPVPEALIISDQGNTLSIMPREVGDENPIPFVADLIMNNQVLHHVGGELGAYKILVEASKCSKIGTKFILNWTTPEQIISFWYLQHHPNLIETFNKLTIPISRLIYIAKEMGWSVEEIKVHNGPDETLQKNKVYLDYLSVTDPKFRSGDPLWSLLKPEQQSQFQTYLIDLSEEQGQEMFKTLDCHRQAFGQSTTVVFHRERNVEEFSHIRIQK